VKLLRAFDASLVLSSKKALSSVTTIKPDMSAEECRTESILLKERQSLSVKSLKVNTLKPQARVCMLVVICMLL